MKRFFSIVNRFSNRHFLGLWFSFHLLVISVFLLTLLFGKTSLKIDADLFNMLPKQFSSESVEKAEAKLSETTSRNVFILSCNKDFESAKAYAEKIHDELKDSSNFKSLVLYQNADVIGDFENFLFKNRFNYIDAYSNPSVLSEKALEKLYSPFTYTSLEYIDQDPFLLTEMEFERYLGCISSNGTSLVLKDNVLAREWNGNWYVMIRGILSREGAALATSKNGIAEIYSVCSKYEKDGQRFVYSGTAFHSHKSSNAASREIRMISIVSLAVVLILLLFVFRTPVPVFLSMASIGVSVLTAFLFTISLFHKIHVLTLVFGTTLIGSCIDYSLHYFINWKGNSSLKSGSEIRSLLFSGIALSFASTEICFAILLFAPFELLRQMAVFSLAGIFSTFLSVICIYPLVKLPYDCNRKIIGLRFMDIIQWKNKNPFGFVATASMFIFSFFCLGFGYGKCSVKNDLSRLYKMEGRLMEDQVESAKVLNYTPRGWFIIRGASADELLVREREFVSGLRNAAGNMSVFCTSDFLPPMNEQKKSKEIYASLLPMMESQLAMIGENESKGKEIISEWEIKKDSFTTMDDFPQFLKELCANSWIGKIDGCWYSVVMPSFMPEELDGKKYASEYEGNVFYINKVFDISNDLDMLTIMILKFFAIACVLIFIILKFFYTLKQTMKIISVPVLIVLMVSSVYSLAGIHMEFFSLTGMILVFGLGLDYVIYMTEMQKKKDSSENRFLEHFAILLSFATTAISFGAIALSSFVPVHLMGLSVLVGLVTAYLASIFYQKWE